MSTIFYKPIVKDLQTKGYEVVSVTSPGPELKELNDMGVKCIEVPMESHISLTKDVKSLIELVKVFSKEKPAMVHSMTPKAGLLCMLAAWLTRVPRRVHTLLIGLANRYRFVSQDSDGYRLVDLRLCYSCNS
jgi:UDP-N-acetylglucosamine:LPS N-acetylglucosamine transferase